MLQLRQRLEQEQATNKHEEQRVRTARATATVLLSAHDAGILGVHPGILRLSVEVVTATEQQLFKGTHALSPPRTAGHVSASSLCHRRVPPPAGGGCAA